MTTQQQARVKPGDYFMTSWGYDQTNIDYLIVTDVSPSGKTAICRMVSPITVGQSQIYNVQMPSTAYGEPFKMKIRPDGRLRGSYPYCNGGKRLDTFTPVKLGDTHYETMPEFGH